MEVSGQIVINNMSIKTSQGVVSWQEEEPSNPVNGDTWFKVVNGVAVNAYTRKNDAWVEVEFASQIIAEELIGKIITGAEINGSVINGGEFNNTFTESVGTNATLTGNTTIQRGIIETQYAINDSTTSALLSSGRQTWNGVNIESVQNGADSLPAASSAFGATGIDMYNKELNSQFGTVHLGYQDLMTLPRKEVTEFGSGFGAYPGQAPSAERYMRSVQLYGAFINNNIIAASQAYEELWMGTLPVGYRPADKIGFVVQGTGANRFLLQIDRNGRIYISRVAGWTGSAYGFVAAAAGSWLNIQCSFIAADI